MTEVSRMFACACIYRHDALCTGRPWGMGPELTMIDTKSEVGTASENGERKIYSEKQTQEELSYR